ncbi:MAG: hypothetical protein U1F68_15890 [Gammaproteobacteria bacterium]
MKRGCWLVAVLGGCLLMTACASLEAFRNLMDSQIGKPIAEVREAFGYHYIERQLEGGKAYTWHWSRSGVSPGYETPTTIQSFGSNRLRDTIISPGAYFPPAYYEEACEFSMITGPGGRVEAWHAQGNGCASYVGAEPVLRSKPRAR